MRCLRGMSLIEVLVSLVVAGLFLSILLPGVRFAVQRSRLSALQAEAVQLTRNQVEFLSVWPATVPVPSQGVANGLSWKVEQISIERPTQEVPSAIVLRTFRITVAVAAADATDPLVDVTIKRLGRAP